VRCLIVCVLQQLRRVAKPLGARTHTARNETITLTIISSCKSFSTCLSLCSHLSLLQSSLITSPFSYRASCSNHSIDNIGYAVCLRSVRISVPHSFPLSMSLLSAMQSYCVVRATSTHSALNPIQLPHSSGRNIRPDDDTRTARAFVRACVRAADLNPPTSDDESRPEATVAARRRHSELEVLHTNAV